VHNEFWCCQHQYSHLNHPQCSNLQIDPGANCELCGSKTSDDRKVRLACIFFSGLKFQNAHFDARHHARCKRPGKASPDRATADLILTTLHGCWSIAACALSFTPVVFDRRQVDLNLKRQLRRWDHALVVAEASKVTMTRWSKLPACCLLLSLAYFLSSV
jgi:hypothetical protein